MFCFCGAEPAVSTTGVLAHLATLLGAAEGVLPGQLQVAGHVPQCARAHRQQHPLQPQTQGHVAATQTLRLLLFNCGAPC